MPKPSTTASSARSSTSTIAFPMPTTSRASSSAAASGAFPMPTTSSESAESTHAGLAPQLAHLHGVGSVRAVTLLTDGSPDANPYRLPRDVRPDRYDIVIEPDLDAARFVGEVHIEATVHAPIDSVTLNAAELECSDVMLSQGGTTSGAEISFDAETERMTLRP
ncbi:MAG: hypothetical protein F4070_09155, partial [Acidimicrobiales bacterium]|nr:hypothetical protein [Acidimicrobiales bacterium]